MTHDNPRMGDLNELVERLQAATMTFDWADLPDDACIPAVPLLREAAAALTSLIAERDGLAKDLAAQIAGHQLTAKQSTDNLMRANTATAKLDEVENRARKHWQAFRDLRLEIIGDGPMCRDCADENGRCPHSGQPCDPDEAVKEQLASWLAAEAQLKAAREHIEQLAELLKIIKEAWVDYDHVYSISVHEADEFLAARTALSLDTNKGDAKP